MLSKILKRLLRTVMERKLEYLGHIARKNDLECLMLAGMLLEGGRNLYGWMRI